MSVCMTIFIRKFGKIEEFHHGRLKLTIQDVYAHARNLHTARWQYENEFVRERSNNNYIINIAFHTL